MWSDNLTQRCGIVTGAVRPGRFGEVTFQLGDRTEAYYAKPFDGQEIIEVGVEVFVIQHDPEFSRTVLVSRFPTSQTTQSPI